MHVRFQILSHPTTSHHITLCLLSLLTPNMFVHPSVRLTFLNVVSPALSLATDTHVDHLYILQYLLSHLTSPHVYLACVRPVVAPPVRVFNPPAKPNGTSNWALWRAKQQEVEEMDTPEKRRRLAEKRYRTVPYCACTDCHCDFMMCLTHCAWLSFLPLSFVAHPYLCLFLYL